MNPTQDEIAELLGLNAERVVHAVKKEHDQGLPVLALLKA
jgi:hypothetical protein